MQGSRCAASRAPIPGHRWGQREWTPGAPGVEPSGPEHGHATHQSAHRPHTPSKNGAWKRPSSTSPAGCGDKKKALCMPIRLGVRPKSYVTPERPMVRSSRPVQFAHPHPQSLSICTGIVAHMEHAETARPTAGLVHASVPIVGTHQGRSLSSLHITPITPRWLSPVDPAMPGSPQLLACLTDCSSGGPRLVVLSVLGCSCPAALHAMWSRSTRASSGCHLSLALVGDELLAESMCPWGLRRAAWAHLPSERDPTG